MLVWQRKKLKKDEEETCMAQRDSSKSDGNNHWCMWKFMISWHGMQQSHDFLTQDAAITCESSWFLYLSWFKDRERYGLEMTKHYKQKQLALYQWKIRMEKQSMLRKYSMCHVIKDNLLTMLDKNLKLILKYPLCKNRTFQINTKKVHRPKDDCWLWHARFGQLNFKDSRDSMWMDCLS